KAYQLESETAGYPRVVVGREAHRYLHMHSMNDDPDPFRQVDRDLARLCLAMLMQDADGVLTIDYLGLAFRNAVVKTGFDDLYQLAREFVLAQWTQHQQSGKSK